MCVCVCVCVCVYLVTQSCQTLCHTMDCSPLGSSVPGIFQTRILEWGAIAVFNNSSVMICRVFTHSYTLVWSLQSTGQVLNEMWIINQSGDLLDGPMAETLHSQCRGPLGSIPGQGTRSTCSKSWQSQIKIIHKLKKKIKMLFKNYWALNVSGALLSLHID